MSKLPYKEFRKDGWPLCPRCGEEELYSRVMIAWMGEGERPTLEDCLKGAMTCYRCNWSSDNMEGLDLAELSRKLGEARHTGHLSLTRAEQR